MALAVFSPDCTHPIGRLLDGRFRHVLVVVWSLPGGAWAALEMDHRAGPRAAAITDPRAFTRDLAARGRCVLRVERPAMMARRLTPLALATCVAQAKLWLGINAPLVFTPRQLYGYLRSHGAVEVDGDERW